MLRAVCFLFVLTSLFSCSGNDNASGVPQKSADTLVPDTSASLSDFTADPFWVGTNDTFSYTGPHNITRDILQDKNGKYWIASWEGLFTYNDTIFTNITLTRGLSHHRIFSLLEDSKGNLWFGTIGAGVYKYDGKNFINYSERNGLIDNNVECLFEDSEGGIWFGTYKGVCWYDGDTINEIIPKEEGKCAVHSISQDPAGVMWFGTDNGVFLYTMQNEVPFDREYKSPFVNVRSVIADKNGDMWIGGANGLYKYDRHAHPRNLLVKVLDNFVSYIREDRAGNLLLSCGAPSVRKNNREGMILYRYDGNTLETITQSSDENAFNSQIFGSIEDKNGNIWYGSPGGICIMEDSGARCFGWE